MAQPLILDQTRATTSSLDRAATQLIGTLANIPLSRHLKKLAIILELTGMASSSGLRARSLTLITLSLRHSARPRCCPARDWALASAGEQRGTRERFEIVVPSCKEESPPVSTLGRAVHLLLHKISTSSSFKLILGDETDRTEAFSITTGHVHSLNINIAHCSISL